MATWWRRMRGSVRVRVTVIAAGVFAVTVLAAGLVLLRSLEQVLLDDVRRGNEAALEQRAEVLRATGLPPEADITIRSDGTYVPLPGAMNRSVVLILPDGQVPDHFETTSPGQAVASGSRRSNSVSTVASAGVSAEMLGIVGSADDYEITSLAFGSFALSTASPLDAVHDTIDSTRRLLWILSPALVALVAGLSWLLAGRALRPVHAVTTQVAAIGSRSLHERVPVPPTGDEIAELATTMNSMLARLDDASTASRRLVSDASHELRTPVAVMRTELDVAERSGERDWDSTSAVLRSELDRLQGLIDDLLLLARGDESVTPDDDVDVTDVLHDVAARRRQVPVDVVGDGAGITVRGDGPALRRALDHVVANAARHAASRVHLTVSADDASGLVSLHVDDDGPGIPLGSRELVTQRFVRLDEGRARDVGGAGLGLAVASDVAAAHGGSLEIDTSPLGGARVTIRLPR